METSKPHQRCEGHPKGTHTFLKSKRKTGDRSCPAEPSGGSSWVPSGRRSVQQAGGLALLRFSKCSPKSSDTTTVARAVPPQRSRIAA